MKRFARTRSEIPARQPAPGVAQCKVGSMEEDGIRYGFTTQALIAKTAPTATTIVTTQSMSVGHGAGKLAVSRSTGPLTKQSSHGFARAARSRCGRGHPRGGLPEPPTRETLQAACTGETRVLLRAPGKNSRTWHSRR